MSLAKGALVLAGAEWTMLDYGDKLALDPETVEALDGLPHSNIEPPDIELRECAIINVIAAHAINEGGGAERGVAFSDRRPGRRPPRS
eukprot:3033116-Pyramimonas_sp.AAC.1